MRHLTDFETVILAIATDAEDLNSPTVSIGQRERRMHNPKPDPKRDIDSAILDSKAIGSRILSYDAAKLSLEGTLCPSTWIYNEQGEASRLKFHPREFDRGQSYKWVWEFFHMIDLSSGQKRNS